MEGDLWKKIILCGRQPSNVIWPLEEENRAPELEAPKLEFDTKHHMSLGLAKKIEMSKMNKNKSFSH